MAATLIESLDAKKQLPPVQHTARNNRSAYSDRLDWGLALGISTADFAAHAFSQDPTSVKNIRRFVRETIASWGLRAFADDLTNVVNELTTNAVQHALIAGDEQRKAWLGIAHTHGAVVCAVTDPSPAPPASIHPNHLALAGRGLIIVDALTSQWGYTPTHSGGKIVWARITTSCR
ncbi:ATP-binding protein [Streptomyces puniciscabiei]|uniref:ATP-binding protein n=1 Tax=Streptomyces puniciscabiei TaxID=164348 RepID=UPI00331755AE